MINVAVVGAGSTVFLRTLVTDILLVPGFSRCHIRLHDIDPQRLAEAEAVVHNLNQLSQAQARVSATADRRAALQGADFVICMLQVGGYQPATVADFEIPKKYGLRQTIGDSLGIGGIMRALRTVPVLEAIARDMLELCPQALMLQYVNPMAMNCWALRRLVPELQLVGLCHSVRNSVAELASDLQVNPKEIVYDCAGVNHLAFFTRLARRRADGALEDLYPRLFELAANKSYGRGLMDCGNRLRYHLMQHFGYFVTESSEHLAEYVPWYIKAAQPELVDEFDIPLDEYPRRCRQQIADWQRGADQAANATSISPSDEYAAEIMQAQCDNKAAVIYANVANQGLISNLPADCCVEVACTVDASGVHPQRYGALPLQLAALMQTNINVQALVVEALVTKRKEHIYQAALLDPHTAAELNVDQICALVDELLAAHREYLPGFS